MAEITAAAVKELREKTGAGMMDCKKALTENNGDFEAAVAWLRTKGLASAAKKSGRVAAEGLVVATVNNLNGILVELNSETDFVARNEKFQTLAHKIANLALTQKQVSVEQIKTLAYPDTGRTVDAEIAENIAVIGENINLRRVHLLSVSQGLVASYVHNAVVADAGKIGVLVALESAAAQEKLAVFGKQIAMHIAASKPEALNASEVDPAAVEREKQIFAEQARASGKPDSIIEKMVEGRLQKYYAEVVLLEQPFVMDPKMKVSEVVEQAGKELGSPVKIAAFARFSLGEGIEQEEKNFADEVAAVRG